MSDIPFSTKLGGTFGYKPQNPLPVAPAPPIEAPKKTYNTRDSVIRDNPIDTTTAVQAMVWGNSSPGPGNQGDPGGPGPGGPPPANLAQTMSNPKGWGQTVG